MAKLAISNMFLGEYARLEQPLQKKVTQIADTFRSQSSAELNANSGLNLKSYANSRDPRAKTIRINDNFRGIVLAVENENLYVLTRILDHDAAEKWMINNEFRVNEATGALEVVDYSLLEGLEQEVEKEPASTSLFGHRKEKDFLRYGVDAKLLPLILSITSREDLDSLCVYMPENQGFALSYLADPISMEEVDRELATLSAGAEDVDTTDVSGAIERAISQSTFYVVEGEEDLTDVMSRPFAQWRTYLHKSQHELAYRPSYSGPAKVTGGAGTGKTVVAMHRAKALADQLDPRDGKQILFTTFTRNLADTIKADLRALSPDLLDVVDVIGLDQFAMQIVRDEEARAPGIATGQVMNKMWRDVVDELGVSFTPEFLAQEWRQIILAQGIDGRDRYLKTKRPGRGVALGKRDRAAVWGAIEAFLRKLSDANSRSFLQMADVAAGYLRSRSVKPYRHVIVDEAQDLHDSQWRMLRAAVAEQADDMFIVGDSHQRIYNNQGSLSSLGIETRGRSHRLRVNYRTSHEILKWALVLLGEDSYDDIDGGLDQTGGYYSRFHGPEPKTAGFKSGAAQTAAVVEQVRQWVDQGIAEHEIGIAARTNKPVEQLQTHLKSAGFDSQLYKQDHLGKEVPGVRLGTMHRFKGLEFRAVAVIDADDKSIPASWDVTPKEADQVQHREDLQRERCLLYVAVTRARDDLWIGWTGEPSRYLDGVVRDS